MFEIQETDTLQEKKDKEIRKKILDFLMEKKENAAIIQELMNLTELSRHPVERHLAFLKGANLVLKVGTAYFITKEGKAQITSVKKK